MEMWEKSTEQDNARFEHSAEMYCDAQNRQMEQTNAILAGFKDIFKDLVSKQEDLLDLITALLKFKSSLSTTVAAQCRFQSSP